jgi:hypothetical protein
LGKQSKKQRKSPRKKARKIVLKFYEPLVEVDHYGFKHRIPVVVLASNWKEAYEKAAETINRTKFWQKTGLRTIGEFR